MARAGWIREEEAATLAEDLRKTKMERDRLLPFVIQKCLNCGAVCAPFETLEEAEQALTEYREALAALPTERTVDG